MLEPSVPTLALLVVTLVLQGAHTGIHVMTSLVWKLDALPSYDAGVGYAGALAWFILVLVDHGTLSAPLMVTIPVGLLIVAAGLYVHIAGIRDITRHKGEGPLVIQGIYAKLRHPIYYGWVLVSFGMPLLTGSWWGLVTAPVWSVLILVCGVLEEKDLRRTLPEGVYDEYARGTRL